MTTAKSKPKLNPVIQCLGIILGLTLTISAGAETRSVLVKTAPVSQKIVTETLTVFGVLDPDPDQVLSLSLPHAGLINRVWVRLGQRVKSGDKLLEVITSPDARMQYLQAQSSLDYAQRELDRQNRLFKEQLATKSQVDAARKNLQDARTTLEAQHMRGMDITKETLRAPMDGIITRLDVSQGQRVQADTSAALIAAERRLIARLGIEPEDLERIKPGTPVSITPVFIPDINVVTNIRSVHAMINPSTNLVDVLAPIPENQIDHLVLGSRILAKIDLESHNALVVPRSAVLGKAPNTYLFTVVEGIAHRVLVRTGIENDNLLEVSGNLKVGDIVVVSGNYELSNGMSVRGAH